MSSYVLENQRGQRRLLRHCRLFGMPRRRRLSARRRLEAAVGREQAGLLLAALTGDHGLVRRGRRRRVTSSP